MTGTLIMLLIATPLLLVLAANLPTRRTRIAGYVATALALGLVAVNGAMST